MKKKKVKSNAKEVDSKNHIIYIHNTYTDRCD